jgi:hypothetical protein
MAAKRFEVVIILVYLVGLSACGRAGPEEVVLVATLGPD